VIPPPLPRFGFSLYVAHRLEQPQDCRRCTCFVGSAGTITSPPAALPLTLTGLGALGINLFCAFLLARFRAHSGSLTRAAFLSVIMMETWRLSMIRSVPLLLLFGLIAWLIFRSDQSRSLVSTA
jgi:hypothetical protein